MTLKNEVVKIAPQGKVKRSYMRVCIPETDAAIGCCSNAHRYRNPNRGSIIIGALWSCHGPSIDDRRRNEMKAA